MSFDWKACTPNGVGLSRCENYPEAPSPRERGFVMCGPQAPRDGVQHQALDDHPGVVTMEMSEISPILTEEARRIKRSIEAIIALFKREPTRSDFTLVH